MPLVFGKMNVCNTMNRRQRHVDSKSTSAAAARNISETNGKIVGLGACGIDTLAVVSSFPKPDDKIRTESSLVCLAAVSAESDGSGNAPWYKLTHHRPQIKCRHKAEETAPTP